MSNSIRFVLVFHNHQPVGNFDSVIEQAYQDSYLPFLGVFSRYPTLRIGLHNSGALMDWLAERHPEYLDRLAELVAAGQIEIIGGAYYEPILSMIPCRDRLGQIEHYSRWLEQRFDCRVRGLWVAERVWEQSMASDLATAGIDYTVLDDFHFKNASLTQQQLHGYYVTEDSGQVLAVFPGSERLRYAIPFKDPQVTIDYLRDIAQQHPGSVVVFADDGEKFGSWPETKKHVYDDGWLARFFDALVANEDWIQVTSLGEAVDHVPPMGKIFLPDSSYREMTEWVLPPDRLVEYERLCHELQNDPRWPVLSQFVKGGFWRNFRAKYPEADEMYARMLMISNRLQAATQTGQSEAQLESARMELYRAQCNCAYWHGAFGGIYLPHLRNAVYRNLITAEHLLNTAERGSEAWIEASAGDFNLDARQEVFLVNDKLATLISPHQGGQLYELDVRSIRHNLLATLARRPEAYHRKVLAGASSAANDVASIHDRVVFKHPDLDQRLHYDSYLRKSLLDHFYDNEVTLAAVAAGQTPERGDFLSGGYEAKVRRNPNRIQVQLSRRGNAWDLPLKITKGMTLEAGSSVLEIAYLLEGLPPQRSFHFAVEFNFAGMPPGWDDRYFCDSNHNRLGHLGSQLDLADCQGISLVDEYLGIDVGLRLSEVSRIWAFPIETVSQSEGGYELVQQSVAVLPHWNVRGDAAGCWSVTMQLSLDTSLAEERQEKAAVAVTS